MLIERHLLRIVPISANSSSEISACTGKVSSAGDAATGIVLFPGVSVKKVTDMLVSLPACLRISVNISITKRSAVQQTECSCLTDRYDGKVFAKQYNTASKLSLQKTDET